MPTLESKLPKSSETSKNIWHHRFNNISELLQAKSLELFSSPSRVFTQALKTSRIFIEEGCNSALCGASHVLAMNN